MFGDSPQTPPQKEFASLTACSIGRGTPSQTLPGGEERAATPGTGGGDTTEKPKRRSPKGRCDASSSPNPPHERPQEGQEATKTAFTVRTTYPRENALQDHSERF